MTPELESKVGGREVWVSTAEGMGVCVIASKCWGTNVASDREGGSLVIHHPILDLSAHLASTAQRHRMLSPCLFTAPAWNSNPTPRERLACANNTVTTDPELSWLTRKARGVPTLARSWGSPPAMLGTVLETHSS